MSGSRGFNPSDLGDANDREVIDATVMARRLDASIEDHPTRVGPGFGDRVMAALADEPAPAPVGFLAPLRRLGLVAGFAASIRQAWATVGSPSRPTFGRAAALAYVLTIAIAGASLVGAAGLGVAGSFGLFNPQTTAAPSLLPSQSTESPRMSSEPEASEPAVEESLEPTESPEPEASDHSGGSQEPGAGGAGSVQGTDGHGGGGSDDGPGSTGSRSGSFSGGGSEDGRQTPGPSESPD